MGGEQDLTKDQTDVGRIICWGINTNVKNKHARTLFGVNVNKRQIFTSRLSYD